METTHGPDWIVRSITLSDDARKYGRARYALHVQGINLNDASHFYWNVPSVENPRYGLAGAVIHESVAAYAMAHWLARF